MSAFSELKTIFTNNKIPIETGVFSNQPPDTYAVVTPLIDVFDLFADNKPNADVSEVRISIFTKDNYLSLVSALVHDLLEAGFTVTERRYLGHEDDTGFHHYAIDVAKEYCVN